MGSDQGHGAFAAGGAPSSGAWATSGGTADQAYQPQFGALGFQQGAQGQQFGQQFDPYSQYAQYGTPQQAQQQQQQQQQQRALPNYGEYYDDLHSAFTHASASAVYSPTAGDGRHFDDLASGRVSASATATQALMQHIPEERPKISTVSHASSVLSHEV